MKCSEKYIKVYIFSIIRWIEFKFENVKYISIYLTNIFKKKLKNIILGGNNLTWKLSWIFQVKLFPPKQFFKYMLMYLTFSNLKSIHWLIKKKKKDIGLNVLVRTFSGHFMTIFRSNYVHLKNIFFYSIFKYSLNIC